MDRKGQIGFGFVIMAAVAILIGLAFYTTTFSDSIGLMTKTYTSNNVTVTMGAENASVEIPQCGQRSLSTIVVNRSNTTDIITTANYTITTAAGTDGYLITKIQTPRYGKYAGYAVNVTCNYEPRGYISDGGSRAIVGLIAIFMALLILVAAIPDLRDKMFEFIRT